MIIVVGNVFMVCLSNSDVKTIDRYADLLINDIPNQSLSIESTLKNNQKAIIHSLVNNDFEMTEHDKLHIMNLPSA